VRGGGRLERFDLADPARRDRLHRNITRSSPMAPESDLAAPGHAAPDLAEVAPTEIRLLKGKTALAVTFDNGEAYEFPAEFLRVLSPSAEVQGHSPDQRKTVGGKRRVAIIEIHPIGNYAVRLGFDDMHSTGIYSWSYFLKLGRAQGRYWREYLDELAAKGLSRDPPPRT
jgi:DUF971 family protein